SAKLPPGLDTEMSPLTMRVTPPVPTRSMEPVRPAHAAPIGPVKQWLPPRPASATYSFPSADMDSPRGLLRCDTTTCTDGLAGAACAGVATTRATPVAAAASAATLMTRLVLR